MIIKEAQNNKQNPDRITSRGFARRTELAAVKHEKHFELYFT